MNGFYVPKSCKLLFGFFIALWWADPASASNKLAAISFEKKAEAIDVKNFVKPETAIPVDCTSQFDKWTVQKSFMFRRILVSIEEKLNSFNSIRPGTYPNKVKIVVSEFNANSSLTYVFIPSMQQVFVVSFLYNYESLKKNTGDYMVTSFYPDYGQKADKLYSQLIKKIMICGSYNEINLVTLPP